jgi:nitroimidazol reductase NimA-like FMN-containing flavoprotein (pyridoxamine 5'-phosphate oxidase superfamily)
LPIAGTAKTLLAGFHEERAKMVIVELPDEQSTAFVARSRKGHLAFTEGSQPFIVPINYVHHEN